jgi:GT2 family glycosyltransferase/uncharacterized membrane protein
MRYEFELSIVVVNFHSLEPLRRLFASAVEHPIAASHEFIVVDNSAGDGVAEWLSAERTRVRLLSNGSNVGYARAVNQGIEAARGEHILVLNPDILLSEGGVDAALDYLRDCPECGLVGARLLDPGGEIQRSARRFYTLKTILLRRTPLGRLMPQHPELRAHLMLDDDLSRPGPVDWVMGAWMLVRREALEAVGGMDERFFLYFEDVDWCYRMWEAGFECHYLPGATFVHEYQRSSARAGSSMLHHVRSFLGFYDKWGALIYVAKRLRGIFERVGAVLGDVLALNLAFLAAFLTRRALDAYFPEALFDLRDYFPLILFTNAVSLVVLPWIGRYQRPEATRRFTRWLNIGRATAFIALIIMAGTYLSHARTFSRAVLLLLIPYLFLCFEMVGILRRRILGGGSEREGHRRRCMLLAERAALANPPFDQESDPLSLVAGVLTESSEAMPPQRILGSFEDALSIVERYRVDEICVLECSRQNQRMESCARELAALGHRVLVRHEWLTRSDPDRQCERLGRRWATVERPAACGDLAWTKLFVDRPLGLVLSLLSLPFFVLCLLFGVSSGLLRLQRQRRVGKARRLVAWSELVRSTSARPLWGITQFPIFFQVLMGRLSLVGPYPILEGDQEELRAHQRLRFAVNPGLTGFWRHHIDNPSILQLTNEDLDYLEQWSISLDLGLFLSALPQLLWSRKLWNGTTSAA